MTGFRNRLVFVSLVILSILSSGCQAPIMSATDAPIVAGPDQALVTLYLEASGSVSPDLSLTLSDVEVLHEGVWMPVVSAPVGVSAGKVRDHQVLLGLGVLPAGRHEQFRLRVTGVRDGRKELPMVTGDVFVSLRADSPISLDAGDSHCLFLQWHLDDCIDDKGRFVPYFQLKDQAEPLTSELLYILCDEINTIYLVRSDRNFVVYSLPLEGPVSDLRLDSGQQLLYILSSGARSILVFDCKRNRLVDRVALPVSVEPRYLDLSSDASFAFVTDAATDKIVKVDLQSGRLVQQANVGYQPGRILYFDYSGSGRLAVSSPDSQQVFLLDADSLQVTSSLSAGFQPEGLLATDDTLYVCDRGSQTVTAYSLRTRSVLSNIPVGREPVALASDGGSKIYVANYGERSLSVVAMGQNVALRQIPVDAGPFSFAYLNHRRVLYVANRKARSVTALDVAGEKAFASIALGGRPLFMAVQD